MLNTIIMTFVCIFAVYGLVNFFGMIGTRLAKGGKVKNAKAHTVLFLYNDGENAESYVRSIIWQRAISGYFEEEDIIAVDMGSKDDTMKIMRKLEWDYDNLHVMKKEEYIDFIKGY